MKRLFKLAFYLIILTVAASLAYRFWPVQALPADAQATRIVVIKHLSQMTLFNGDRKLKSYRVSLGQNPGPKERQGDRRTPEGEYRIASRNLGSSYYKAFLISYPNADDKKRAQRLGIKDPGSLIELHGIMPKLAWVGRLHNLIDYTRGCIAVTNEEMDELWRAVKVGTPIHIKP